MTLQGCTSEGFTLVELLIVVAIIAIVAGIVIPTLLSARKKSQYARASSDIKTAVATQACTAPGGVR